MFSGAISESRLARMGRIYPGKPLKSKNRRELLATIRPNYRQYLRADNGDLPEEDVPRTAAASMADASESPPLPPTSSRRRPAVGGKGIGCFPGP